MEGNASVYQVNPVVSRITGEGRAEFLRAWGPRFDHYTSYINPLSIRGTLSYKMDSNRRVYEDN